MPVAAWTTRLLYLARGLLIVWAGFWSWFALVHLAEGLGALPHVAKIVVPLAGVAVLAWTRPFWGGLVLLAGALLTAWYFEHSAARFMLSLPAMLLAVMFVVIARFDSQPEQTLQRGSHQDESEPT
ncbi:MAG TPA: hypothetical protein QGF95_10935 [Candidatus Latescibacteria bacterium]|jgi:hypothetical protein|nr:hypothetical protein [Gemmatimonadaceae bacterium]MDP6015792.1 hypothetical protein [Candidatus Latescibacterota bacterium]HJP31059.1 hypothetical protein [Candidatus Latescibacterota bacterium]|tara:strand:- start:718 stop:1095 length:378 start_codon:yes stop_codon:yes gene_type:complete